MFGGAAFMGGGFQTATRSTGGGGPRASLVSQFMTSYWDSTALPIAFSYSGGEWSSDFDFGDFLPIADADATYYVDVAAGSDSNDGLSSGAAFKSIHRAHTVANADGGVSAYIVYVKAGRYNRANGINNSGGVNPTKQCWIIATDGQVFTGTFEALTWTNDGSGTNTYQATRSNSACAVSIDSVNEFGNHPDHTKLASQAAVQASSGENVWAQVGSIVYAKRADGGVINDTNIVVPLLISGVTITNDFYMSGVDFLGGATAGQGCFYLNAGTGNAIFEDCSFKYSGTVATEACGTTILNWTGQVIFNRVLWGANSQDGMNPHWDAVGDVATQVVMLDCSGHDIGRASGGSYNAITSHDEIPIIDMNGDYGEGRGGTFRIVSQSKALALGTLSENDLGSGSSSASQFRSDDSGTIMWLLDCTATASPASNNSLVASNGGYLGYFNITNTGQISQVGSTVEELAA